MNPYGSAAVKSLLPETLFAQFEQTAAITRIGGTKMKYDGTVLQSQEGHGGFLGGLGPVRGIPIPKPGVPTEPSKPGQYGVYTVDR